MKLFILGNGFDIAHGLRTRYSDYREFLKTNDKNFLCQFENQFPFCGNALWGNLEENIDQINLLDDLSYDEIDLGLECEVDIQYTLDADYKDKFDFLNRYGINLNSWIESIEINSVSRKTNNFGNDCYFITFNYTKVLEEIYEIGEQHILHIHGCVGEELILGKDNSEHIDNLVDTEDTSSEWVKAVKPYLQDYLLITNKDTVELCEKVENFIESLDIEEINIIGLSVSSADISYLIKIKQMVNQNCVWNFYYYLDEQTNNNDNCEVRDEEEINAYIKNNYPNLSQINEGLEINYINSANFFNI